MAVRLDRAVDRTDQPRAGDSVAGRLSPQEFEIVGLATSGLTNKQMAERLFVSPRTVGGHLHRAFPQARCRNSSGPLRRAPVPAPRAATPQVGLFQKSVIKAASPNAHNRAHQGVVCGSDKFVR